MHISLYNATVPVLARSLNNLTVWLEKAEQYAAEKGFPAEQFLGERLVVDQFPFVRQVQIASDNAKGLVARLAGMEPPKMEDTEVSIVELKERIAKTVRFIESIEPEQIDGQEERMIAMPYMPGKQLSGLDYAVSYALPNFFFHYTTAYSILRKNGVPVGKVDFIGSLNFQEM